MNQFLQRALSYSEQRRVDSLHFLSKPRIHTISHNQPIGLIVIGGTSVRIARAEKKHVEYTISHLTTYPIGLLPSGEALISLIVDIIKTYFLDIDDIRINLAFPMYATLTVDGNYDSIIYKSAKGHNVDSIINKPIGSFIIDRIPEKKCTVFNDCEVLARTTKGTETHAVLIVGTGVNAGYYTNDGVFINLEIGKMCGFTPPELYAGWEFGDDMLEKIVGGGYLIHNMTKVYISRYGSMPPIDKDAMISDLITHANPHIAQSAQLVLEQSIRYCGYVVESLIHVTKKADTNTISNPFVVQVEGGLFWNCPGYKEGVVEYLVSQGFFVTFTECSQSYFKGLL